METTKSYYCIEKTKTENFTKNIYSSNLCAVYLNNHKIRLQLSYQLYPFHYTPATTNLIKNLTR